MVSRTLAKIRAAQELYPWARGTLGEGELRGTKTTKRGAEEHREAESHPSCESSSPLGVAEHHSIEQGVQTPGTCPRLSGESVKMLSKARAVYALPGSLETVAEDYKYC